MNKPALNSELTPNPNGHFRLGELLVREKMVGQQDIDRVLQLQQQEKQLIGLPLGQILVKQGKLSEKDLHRLQEHPSFRKHLGTLAVEKKYVSQEQLMFCLQKKDPGKALGQALIDEGFLDEAALYELIKEQACSDKLGDLAIKLNLVSQQDIATALKTQKASRSLGEICCDLGLISPLDLDRILNKYDKQTKLGEILIKLGYLDPDKLQKNLAQQQREGIPLGTLLINNKLITNSQLQEAISKQAGIPFKALEGFIYSENDKKALTRIISPKYAEKNLILPISMQGNELTVATLSAEKIRTVRDLNQLYDHLNISCIFITETKFAELFEILYSKKLSGQRSPEAKTESEESTPEAGPADSMQLELSEDIDEVADTQNDYGAYDLETEELVNYIVKYGITHKASDIHFEQDRKGAKLRFRIDGVLREVKAGWLQNKINEKPAAIVSRIKVMSSLDISERRIPQDGVFRINYFDRTMGQKYNLDFRVATCPAISGENITIRILDSRKANVGLEKLNHSPHVLDPFKIFLKSAAGMVLVTGPTGSGKSSTLYGALQYIYDPTLKIITAEDPIEYSFPGIMQTQINPKIGLSFAQLMRSFLRLDPDVILVGEMRDEETTHIGFDAAQTGHLVLSTLHTNDAISTLGRLDDLGVDRAQIAASLSCVLAQRLVRRICPTCLADYVPSEEEWSPLFNDYPTHLTFFKGEGCNDCDFTGFSGRTLLSELFVPSDFKSFSKGASVDELKAEAVEKGLMKTMVDDGLLKLGDTTISEILRVVPHEMIQMFRKRGLNAAAGSGEPAPASSTGRGRGFMLTDPATEGVRIDQMYEEYQSLAAISQSKEQIDRELFGRFINDNFHELRLSTGSRSILFNFESEDGNVRITAVPLG
ncbi:type II/IV secretion system protein [Desulfurivibrio alkaliphilus]|nr:ATPase, T2SS/T4P/T4SS family [Desulfurivibrio alkaliphilus]